MVKTIAPLVKSATIAIVALAVGATVASAGTASRVGAGTQPEKKVWLSPPGEINDARLLLQAGKPAKAEMIARKFLKEQDLPPAYVYAGYNALCVALAAQSRYDDAIAACNAAIRIAPKRVEAINSRGTAHYVAGRFEQARTDWGRALTLDPENIVVQHNLALAPKQQ